MSCVPSSLYSGPTVDIHGRSLRGGKNKLYHARRLAENAVAGRLAEIADITEMKCDSIAQSALDKNKGQDVAVLNAEPAREQNLSYLQYLERMDEQAAASRVIQTRVRVRRRRKERVAAEALLVAQAAPAASSGGSSIYAWRRAQ